MASVVKRGENYRIEVYCGIQDGKKIHKYATFRPDPAKSEKKNQKALEEFIFKFEQRCKTGEVASDSTTFKEYAQEWMNKYRSELESTTVSTYIGCLNKAIIPYIGYMKLSSIKPATIQDFVNSLRKKTYSYNKGQRKGHYSEEYIRNCKAVISSILSTAQENGLIPSNPCSVRIRRNKSQKEIERQAHKIQCFTPEEAALFLDVISNPIPITVQEHTQIRKGKKVIIKAHAQGTMNVSPQLQTFFWLAIYSGCRRGELIGLTWKYVNFEKNCITIERSLAYTSKSGAYVKAPKTSAGYRDIDMVPSVMEMLKTQKESAEAWMQNMGTAWKGKRNIEDCPVFMQEDGTPMSLCTPRRTMQRAINCYNESRKEGQPELPLIRLHDLRHTTASILISSKLDPPSVASRLGHADPSVTMRIYSHAFKNRDHLASMAIQESLSNARNENNQPSDQGK